MKLFPDKYFNHKSKNNSDSKCRVKILRSDKKLEILISLIFYLLERFDILCEDLMILCTFEESNFLRRNI